MTILKPTVTFIVPCYKLAHLLKECVQSILNQTFRDFEILIMDDFSPDNTPLIANSFRDARVKHIRNEPNLGHLRNYNKGIEFAQGRYIWLISADDYLRSEHILERYLAVLEADSRIGYAYCSGVGVINGKETGILPYSLYAHNDQIVDGHSFLKTIIKSNIVLAASGLARRECYDKLGRFPLNLPFAGDWYLWALFALYYDVAYFAEPMVAYRQHELSMTTALNQKSPKQCCEEDVAVPWAIKAKIDEAKFEHLKRVCMNAIAEIYSRNITKRRYGMSGPSLTLEEFELSLCNQTSTESERTYIRAKTYALMGNEYFWEDKLQAAWEYYLKGLKLNPSMLPIYLKLLLLSLGKPGAMLRKKISPFN
jgi:glycosyltransferase involved in cell wall biosynthesis